MDLSIREVAQLLGVTEKTVHRWLREKAIPAHRLHDQFLFNRVEIQEWAAGRGLKLSPTISRTTGLRPMPASSLRAAIERGGIHFRVPGKTPEEVLDAVTRLPGIPERRESLSPPGAARGPRGADVDRHRRRDRDPTSLATRSWCRSESPWSSPASSSNRSTSTRSTERRSACSSRCSLPSIRAHLQMLSRLTYALHDSELSKLLEKPTTAEAILDRLGAIELQERAPQK